jgi:Leucine-rich repeat (LRR) protein
MICALVATLVLASLLLPAARAVDSVVDRTALVDFYQAMGGAQWIRNASWLAPNMSMCSWYGVVCGSCPITNGTSVECRVAELNLGLNGLQGPIAPAVQQLANLTKLVLYGNALGGTIPSFSALTNLQWLDLKTAELTGLIPEFDALVNLRFLNLFDNRLTGTIPAFTALTQLRSLYLNTNSLTGTLSAFATLVQLEELNLSNNKLTGTIPDFSALAQLREVYLSANLLYGAVPAFAANVQLQHLILNNNMLSGTVPAFEALAQLDRLNLYNNRLNGTIPAFAHMTRLTLLDLSANQLTGTIPSFETLLQLRQLSLSVNRLEGSVPTFAALARLRSLTLHTNLLSGPVPSFATLALLEVLRLSNNRLSGSVPEFANLSSLIQLYLDKNRLEGTISSFPSLVQLQQLHLNNNMLSGTIPTFEALGGLERLILHSNRFVGTVPLFTTLGELRTLDLQSNSLSGSVPDFDNTPELERLDLSTNQLSGALPSLSSLSKLSLLRIARNRLTGSLPMSWRTLRKLDLVDLSGNMLDGHVNCFQHNTLPPLSAAIVDLSFNRFGGTFGALPPPELTSIDVRGNQLLCPYPEFLPSLRVLRDDCRNDWVQLGTYAGVAIGVAVAGIALFLVIKRLVSEQRLRIALFSISWFVSAISVLSDAYSYAAIVRFLQTRSGNCVSINDDRVFYPLVAIASDRTLIVSKSAFLGRASFLFSEWINLPRWGQTIILDPDLSNRLRGTFAAACRQARECEYDDALAQCYGAHPELSTSGGDAHQAFLAAIFAFIAIRAAYELFCLIVIAICCVRDSLLLSFRVWIKGSAFLPLLLVRAATRSELLKSVVLADTPPSEYIWELLTSGVFVTALKLVAETYYLLIVAQTGLVWSNWLSLALGIVTVVRLVGQAAWSWRKTRQNALLEEHYAERAASGADFELSDIGGSGSDKAAAVRLP